MFKKLGSLFLLFLFVTSISAYGQVKIGYMNSQEVLSQMPERSDVEQKLNSFIQQKRQELQERTASFQDSVASLQQNRENLSKAQEQRLAEMEASLQQFKRSIQQQVQQRRSQLLRPLYQKMDQAIATVAEKKDLDFVINEATNTGENVIYYSESPELDITEEVLQRIKGTSAQN